MSEKINTKPFILHSHFKPSGDQPQAIAKLAENLEDGLAHQTLLGVTGSGKTFTIANVNTEALMKCLAGIILIFFAMSLLYGTTLPISGGAALFVR